MYFKNGEQPFDEALIRLRRLWMKDYTLDQQADRTLATIRTRYGNNTELFRTAMRDMDAQRVAPMKVLITEAKEAIQADIFPVALNAWMQCSGYEARYDVIMRDHLAALNASITESWPITGTEDDEHLNFDGSWIDQLSLGVKFDAPAPTSDAEFDDLRLYGRGLRPEDIDGAGWTTDSTGKRYRISVRMFYETRGIYKHIVDLREMMRQEANT